MSGADHHPGPGRAAGRPPCGPHRSFAALAQGFTAPIRCLIDESSPPPAPAGGIVRGESDPTSPARPRCSAVIAQSGSSPNGTAASASARREARLCRTSPRNRLMPPNGWWRRFHRQPRLRASCGKRKIGRAARAYVSRPPSNVKGCRLSRRTSGPVLSAASANRGLLSAKMPP